MTVMETDHPTIDPQGGAADSLLFKMAIEKLMLVVPVLADVDLKGITDVVDAAHNVAWFLDPTAYNDALHRGDMDRLAKLAELCKPVAAYFKEEIEPRMATT